DSTYRTTRRHVVFTVLDRALRRIRTTAVRQLVNDENHRIMPQAELGLLPEHETKPRRQCDAIANRPPYPVGMRAVRPIFHRRHKVDALGFPWATAVLMQAVVSGLAIAAIAQRGAHPLVWTVLAGLLTLIPGLCYGATGGRIPVIGLAPPLLIATALLVWTHPVAFDIAPFVLMIGLGAAAIHCSVLQCAATAVAFATTLIGASLTNRI